MRSLVSEPNVGLLLFDEPSASLDPTAEHGQYSFHIFFVFDPGNRFIREASPTER